MQNFLELQCLVDDLVDFLRVSLFINTPLPLNILFDDMDRGFGQQKKKHFVRYHLYRCFFLKTVMDDLNLQLVVTLVENKFCTKKDDYM